MRSTEIKKLLKSEFPDAIFKVRIHKYSMGESINVNTDLLQREKVEDTGSYLGYSMKMTDQSKRNLEQIKNLIGDHEHLDRDESGDILSGGNTFLFIETLN